jgi:hypothetical protein
MKEKILALLLAKFAGVRKDGLEQLAKSMALQVEKEDEATALVEKLTADNVNNFVKDWRSAVDKEVSDGTKTHEATLRKKYDLVEKKEPKEPGKDPKEPTDSTDIASIVANAVKAAVEPLQKELSSFKGEKVTETRLQVLQQKFAVIPEGNKLAEEFKAQKLKDFKRMNFESDEAFNEYLTEVESGVASFNQNLADSNLSEQGKPIFGKKEADGVSTGVKQFVQSKKEEAEKGKPLDGKAV